MTALSLGKLPLLIRADAHAQIGTGHLMRCLALAQAWQAQGGEAVFVTACDSEGLLQRLRDEKFRVMELEELLLIDRRPSSIVYLRTTDDRR